MNKPSLALLVSESAAHVASVAQALQGSEEECLLQHIERVRMALARIAGGGIGLVLLDISPGHPMRSRDAFLALRSGAPDLLLIILCELEDEPLAKEMVRDGAGSFVLSSNWQRDLKQCVLGEIARRQAALRRADRKKARKGTLVTVTGAKGGVGASTVASNVAAALAASSKVLLADLRSTAGSLCHMFRPNRGTRDLGHLLSSNGLGIGPADLEACLWSNRSIPGLSILFAPDPATTEMETDQMQDIVAHVADLSDACIADLPPTLSKTDRVVLDASDTVALVMERDAPSVDAARSRLKAFSDAGISPREMGLVIVNRVPLAAPLAIADIESQLGLSVLGVIPPAADLCAAAYRAHNPVVKFDARSSLAVSLVNLAQKLSGRS